MRLASIVIKLVISVVAIGYVLSQVSWFDVTNHFLDLDARWLTASFILLFGNIYLGATRWCACVENFERKLPIPLGIKLTWISLFFNLIAPGTVGGDVYRTIKLKQWGIDLMTGGVSVGFERVFMILGLLLTSFGGFILSGLSAKLSDILISIIALLIACFIIGVFGLKSLHQILPSWRENIEILRDGVHVLFVDRSRLAKLVFNSCAAAVNLVLVLHLILYSLDASIPFSYSMTLVPLVILISTVPASIGGWGTREAGTLFLFALVDIESGIAVSMSILYGLIQTMVAVPGGLLLLSRSNKN